MAESPELNRIVSDLNDGRDVTLSDLSGTRLLDRWLTALVQQGGSDLLLVPNAPPCLRFEGKIRQLESGALGGAEIEAAVLPALTSHASATLSENADRRFVLPHPRARTLPHQSPS